MQSFILSHAPNAYWIIFGLLVIAGLNVPISEDIVVLTGGYLASTYNDDLYTTKLSMAIFFGAFFGDCLLFFTGRYFGPALLDTRLFSKLIDEQKRQKMEQYFERYGTWTLFWGRFIPFGVRNGLIITAAFSNVRFVHFAISDLLAMSISTSLLFWLGYRYADHLETIIIYIRQSSVLIIVLTIILVTLLVLRHYRRSRH